MFKHKLTAGIILLVSVTISCTNNKKAEKEIVHQEASLIEVSIGGMSCLDCEQTIQNNVGKLEGIKSVKASFTVGNAVVEYFPQQVDTLKIKGVIVGSGYTVRKFIVFQPKDTAEKI